MSRVVSTSLIHAIELVQLRGYIVCSPARLSSFVSRITKRTSLGLFFVRSDSYNRTLPLRTPQISDSLSMVYGQILVRVSRSVKKMSDWIAFQVLTFPDALLTSCQVCVGVPINHFLIKRSALWNDYSY